MTDQESPTSEVQPQKPVNKKSKKRFGKLKLYLIVMIIFAIALIAGFILLQRSTGFFSGLLNSAPADQIKLLQQQVDSNQNAIAELTQSQNKPQVGGTLIAASNLISFANFSLAVEHNIPATIQLLEQAKSYLDQIDNGMVSVLKTSVSNNILQLQALPKIKTNEIYAKLQNLSQQTSQLTLINEGSKILTTVSQKPVESGSFWHRGWHATLEQLKSLVIIRHRDSLIEPLLSNKQQQLLVLNLQLLFSQAQTALLNHHQQIFVSSLQKIQSTVKEYFLQTNAATATFLKELDQISKTNITPALPDLSKSLVIAQALTQPANPKDAEK